MAEAVGLAASVAGLVAITGQIGKSILFIKGFWEDIKNAPDEIRSLASELELLASAANKTEEWLVKCHNDGLEIDLEEDKKVLQRYTDMIQNLKGKIEKDVLTFGTGKGRWRERVGSATRKKSVGEYLDRVERAKTLVIEIGTKVIIQLQHKHGSSLDEMNQSLAALRITIDEHSSLLNSISANTSQIATLTGTTGQALATLTTGVQQNGDSLITANQSLQGLLELSNGNTTTLNNVEGHTSQIANWTSKMDGPLATITTGVQQHGESLTTTNRTLDTLCMSSDRNTATLSSVETHMSHLSARTGNIDQALTTMSTSIEQINTSRPQLVGEAALEAVVKSAVAYELRKHIEELRTIYSSSRHSLPEVQAISGSTNTSTEDLNEQLYTGDYMTIRRDKTVSRTTFQTPLFDIYIETKEIQRTSKPKKGTPPDEISRLKPTHSQRFTRYSVRVKIPFWRRGVTFHSGNAGMVYGGNLCKTFRIYNEVSADAPIIKACERYDLLEVRRLIESGFASPLDTINGSSLAAIVISGIIRRIAGRRTDLAIEVLKYLAYYTGGDVGKLKLKRIFFDMYFSDFFFDMNVSDITNDPAGMAKICRFAIEHSSEDPLDGIGRFLNLRFSRTPLYKVLIAQEKWWIEEEILWGREGSLRTWVETDLQMLKDPEGLSLKAALAKGLKYLPFNHKRRDETRVGRYPLHLLLAVASDTVDDKLHTCILSRLVILLAHGQNPREVCFFEGIEGMQRPLSCTEFAQLLGLSDLWCKSLEAAGWHISSIDALFEDDLCQAVIALLTGEIVYQSRDDNRREFMEDLRRGKFMDLEGAALYDYSYPAEYELGFGWHWISHMISEVNSLLKPCSAPGSWPNEERSVLIPGKDFGLPRCYGEYDAVKDWKCVREIWENELGGHIPEGYEDSGSSKIRKGWKA